MLKYPKMKIAWPAKYHAARVFSLAFLFWFFWLPFSWLFHPCLLHFSFTSHPTKHSTRFVFSSHLVFLLIVYQILNANFNYHTYIQYVIYICTSSYTHICTQIHMYINICLFMWEWVFKRNILAQTYCLTCRAIYIFQKNLNFLLVIFFFSQI